MELTTTLAAQGYVRNLAAIAPEAEPAGPTFASVWPLNTT